MWLEKPFSVRWLDLMWNVPSDEELASLPRLYEQDGKGKGTLIHLHFFMGNSDWFISEFDGKDTFFGFVCLNGWTDLAEWGYISFMELKELNFRGLEVDRDTYWETKKAYDVPLIKECEGW